MCNDAGIDDFRFHNLRHTFASYLRQNGVDLHTISELLGHREIRMTQRYSHLSVENLREAISVLDKPNVTILLHLARQSRMSGAKSLFLLAVPTGFEPVF